MTFRLASDDPRAFSLEFISRPLRRTILHTVNGTKDVSPLYESNNVLFGGKIFDISLKSWQMAILEVKDILLENGTISLGAFVDGGVRGSKNAVIRVYRTLADAKSQKNFITEFKLCNVQRWLVFESEISDLSNLYIRIDNLDMVGDFTLWFQVNSFGVYY